MATADRSKSSPENLSDYRSVVEAAGLLDCSARGKLKITGPDRVSFLHALVTNDVQQLEEYRGCPALLLTSTGKIISDFRCYRLPDYLLLDTTTGFDEQLAEAFRQYIIMDDVEIENLTGGFFHFSLQGPRSREILSTLFDTPLPKEPLEIRVTTWQGSEVWIVRHDELADLGFEILAGGKVGDLAQELVTTGEESGLREVGDRAFEILRVERNIRLLGKDMTGKNNPLEAGLKQAISLEKGCFVGQEVIARATYVGGVARRLVGFETDADEAIEEGSPIFDSEDEEVGRVTSSVFSPRLGKAIGFALVKKRGAEPGMIHTIRVESGQPVRAEMVTDFDSGTASDGK